ncbi:MAG: tryptophan-rich sensory protein [Gemmatimonadota bacterium]
MSGASIAFAVGWAVVTAALGAVATRLGDWYRRLRKPPWQPPDAAFGPAWTTIFIASGVAAVLAWNADDATTGHRAAIVGAYVLNGLLNFLWSVLFFTLRRPDWALIETPILWLSIVAMIGVVAPLSTAGGWLIAPYLLWVVFAFAINRWVVRHNGPFGA